MTKHILLTQGKSTLISDDDYEYQSQWKWFFDGRYAVRNDASSGKKKIIRMHRAIAKPPAGKQVDHINGDKLDNRRENLRVCTQSENLRNRGADRNNPTGYKGVSLNGKKYYAMIGINKDIIRLGSFTDPIEAAKAYDKAAKELHGEFARTNF